MDETSKNAWKGKKKDLNPEEKEKQKRKNKKIFKFGCLPIFGIFILIIIITNIGSNNSSDINYPYKLIETKKESTGPANYHLKNTMSLYTVPNELNIDTLKQFSLDKKKEFSNDELGIFLYLVFFDSTENAVFPNNPFTAFYGTDSTALKHIKAYYEYNRLNGFSKLNIYKENAWNSSAKVINLSN